MAKMIPYKIREQIIEDRNSGLTYSSIADKYGYSLNGVKKIWYSYQSEGASALSPKYSNCGRKQSYDSDIRQLIDAHRKGAEGAPFIRSVLLEKYPDRRIPHARTIQRWWKESGTHRPKGRPKKREATWTRDAHEVWQIDGKEQIRLGNGQEVSWLNVVDEASKAQLSTELSPQKNDGPTGSKTSNKDGKSKL